MVSTYQHSGLSTSISSLASSSQPFSTPTTPISSTPSWEGISLLWPPSPRCLSYFPPPRAVSTPIMSTLSLPKLTLGVPIWYLDPSTPLVPSMPTPHLVLTLVQLMGSTLVPSVGSTQAQLAPTNAGKGVSMVGKHKNKGGTNNSRQAMTTQTTAPRVIPHVLYVTSPDL
jgi:hypothetical protein